MQVMTKHSMKGGRIRNPVITGRLVVEGYTHEKQGEQHCGHESKRKFVVWKFLNMHGNRHRSWLLTSGGAVVNFNTVSRHEPQDIYILHHWMTCLFGSPDLSNE